MDIEKLLGITPLQIEKKSSKDLIVEVDQFAKDPTPVVPDLDFDYLFTSWGYKEPEKPYVKAAKKGDAKEIKHAATKELGISDKEEDKKEESYISAREAINEMNLFDGIYKAIMRSVTPSTEKEESKEKIFKKIDEIVKESFGDNKVKVSSPKRYDDEEVMGINYKAKIGKMDYAIHTYLVKSSKVFMISLWNKEETRIEEMLCEGYLQEKFYLVGLVKQRLKSYLEKKHGSKK